MGVGEKVGVGENSCDEADEEAACDVDDEDAEGKGGVDVALDIAGE